MTSPSEIGARIERTPTSVLIGLLLLLQTAIQLPHLASPPAPFHLWRQTQTLAVARNFHLEGMNPFLPRVDSRGAGPGFAGMEFPLVNFAIAVGYRAFGEHDWVHRLVLLATSFLAIAGCFVWAQALLGSRLGGLAAALALTLSPLFSYYAPLAVPDTPMLGFLFFGMAWLRRGAVSSRLGPVLAGCAALTVAGLIKISSLLAWPAAFVCLAGAWRTTPRPWLATIAAAAACGVALIVTWYAYAAHLSTVYHNTDFLLATKWPYPAQIVGPVLWKVFVQWLPEVYLSYPEFAFFVVGLVSLRSMRRGVGIDVLLFALGLAAYMVAYLPSLEIHDYYMIVALPPLVLVAAAGVLALWEQARTHRAAAVALTVLTLAALVVGPVRAQLRYRNPAVRADLATLPAHLDQVLPDRRAPLIIASDPSPSIYLYFARRKGWPTTAEVTPDRFREMVAQGATALVSDSRELEVRDDVRPWLRPLSRHGTFNVFAIEAPPARGAPAPR